VTTSWLHWIPLLPLLGAAVNLMVGRKLPRWLSALVAVAAVGAAAAVVLGLVAGPLYDAWRSARLHDAHVRPFLDPVYTWIESGTADPAQRLSEHLSIGLSFRLDPLSAVMIFTVTFVGFLIHVYSIGYMAHDPRRSTYFGYLNLFTGAMLILVLGDSLPVLFIGWEGVGTCSYLLIGFWFDKEANANAGRKAFVVNRIGDFGFLLGIFLLWTVTRRLDFDGIAAACQAGGPLTNPKALAGGLGMIPAFWIGLLLFVGACGKSAQIPLYVWLPDAMAGPTPVSALIHAATMVTAGVYMVARMNFLYALSPELLMIVAGIGAATALFAAIIGFAQRDIKKVLAYSTISQLGFMFVGVGTGAFGAGIFHLFTHAFFKAGLFLGAGSVMHAMGDRTDIMIMGGLRKKTPVTHAVFLIYCLAIAGIPPFAGFFSKDDILAAAFFGHDGWPVWYGKVLWGVLSTAALGTAFYMFRLYFLVFSGENRADADVQHHIHESPAVMTVPLVVLAVGATVLGFLAVPEVLGEPLHFANFWEQWLGAGTFPEVAAHPGATVLGLMGLATGLAVVGIGAAFAIYRNGPEGAAGLVGALGPVKTLVENKFYIDELNDLVIVRPFRWVARRTFELVDRIVIDTLLIGAWGVLCSIAGRAARAWQNGDVQRYLVAMMLGLAAIVYFSTRMHDDFSVTPGDGTTVRFKANLGDGIEARGAQARWDFDGDGKPDSTGPEASWTYGSPGTYAVELQVTDVFGRTATVKRSVEVGKQ
jgi:NADH-quinone oxidoreductase subunit L